MKLRSDSSQLRLHGGRRVSVVCGGPRIGEGLGCGKESRIVVAPSPAAPTLTAVHDVLAKEGWWCDIGPWSMMLGHSVLCPECAAKLHAATKEGLDASTNVQGR